MDENGCPDAAITDRGNYGAGNKHLYILMPSHVPLKTMTSSNKLDLCTKTHHSQLRWQRERGDNLEWKGVIGSLASAPIEEILCSIKNSLQQTGCWISTTRFTCWNQVLFFTFSEVVASSRPWTIGTRIKLRMSLDHSSSRMFDFWKVATYHPNGFELSNKELSPI